MDDDENVDISPRSSVQIDEESGVTTEAEVPFTGTTAEQDSELVTPVEIAESQGDLDQI